MRWVLGALCGSLSGSYAGQFCGGVVSQPQAVSSTPRSLSSSPALEQITTPHALAVPPPESLSRAPFGAIFCLSSGVLHIFQLLTCAPIGGAVGDAWAVLISSTSTPHPIRRTQTKREGAPLARPQPSTPNTKKSVVNTTLQHYPHYSHFMPLISHLSPAVVSPAVHPSVTLLAMRLSSSATPSYPNILKSIPSTTI